MIAEIATIAALVVSIINNNNNNDDDNKTNDLILNLTPVNVTQHSRIE